MRIKRLHAHYSGESSRLIEMIKIEYDSSRRFPGTNYNHNCDKSFSTNIYEYVNKIDKIMYEYSCVFGLFLRQRHQKKRQVNQAQRMC